MSRGMKVTAASQISTSAFCTCCAQLPLGVSARRLQSLRERPRHGKRTRCACGAACLKNDHVAGRLLLDPAGLARERRAAELLRLQQALQCDTDIGIGIPAPVAADGKIGGGGGGAKGQMGKGAKWRPRAHKRMSHLLFLRFAPADPPGKSGVHDHSGFVLGQHVKINRAVQGRAVAHTKAFRRVPAPARKICLFSAFRWKEMG